MRKHFLALVVGLTMTCALQAGSIRDRQHNQRQRINQGLRSGELTGREASRLYTRQEALKRTAIRDRRDGHGLTWGERAKLDWQQDRLSRSIYRQKHDRQDR